MAVNIVGKVDSNNTGIRYCEEDPTQKIGTLPVATAQTWYLVEPNTEPDFGAKTKTVARMPINPSRQLRKGTLVDLDPSASFSNDLTQDGLTRLLQGFFFANIVEAFDSTPYNTAFDGNVTSAVALVVASSHKYEFAAVGTAFTSLEAGDLMSMSGFTNTSNNGLFNVSSVTASAAAGTFTTTGNLANNDTITIGTRVYTFQTALTATDGHVLIGASATATMLNFQHAINNSGGVAGTDYFVTQADKNVTALATSSAITVTAINKGYGANTVATTTTSAAGSWGGAVMSGGVADMVVTQTGVVNETPTSAARIQNVGFQGTTGDLTITNAGGGVSFPVLGSTSLDFTTLPIQIGQWLWIGGDAASTEFATVADNGWARIRSIAAHALTLDKTSNEMVTDSGTGQTIQFFFGKFLINQPLPQNQKRRTYTFERTLGNPDLNNPSASQAEYVSGTVANEMTVNMTTAEKITLDLSFLSCTYTTIDTTGTILSQVVGANAPALASEDAYNTTSDVTRAKITVLGSTPTNLLPSGQQAFDAAPTALFAEVTELKFVIKNNLKANKAVAKLGPWEITAGFFEGSGSVQAYFNTVDAVQAVRNNVDASLDFAVARGNAGIMFDLPLLTLMTKGLDVKINEPILLPLELQLGADRNFNFTMSLGWFSYLPSVAMPS